MLELPLSRLRQLSLLGSPVRKSNHVVLSISSAALFLDTFLVARGYPDAFEVMSASIARSQ